MKVTVKYFAFLQDYTGKESEVVETNCKDVDCLKSQLEDKYGKEFGKILREGLGNIKVSVLVNGRKKEEINDGDEIAIFPPPAGGELKIGKRLDILEEIREFRNEADEQVGSMVVYLGIVKGIVEGHKVYELKYQAYEEYTKKRFEEIISTLKEKYKDLVKMKIIHVIDDLKPGEDVFLVMALGRGRKDTINAVEEAVEMVKHSTGIWKLEVRDDGQFWVVAGNTRVRRNEQGGSP
ncbi:MoaD family protein [Stygiolobus caldivivus]|uniref:Molybdenum biosynthesis protein MoaD n=1 Tax=Stygiolobus caldivivus TaxID=2824673 RepID=A0A8D5U440_9CREN|nr:MoaD family protein [Stygiolobus caldivivus]BCU69026.1 molybdenum biosynthesis protein MoaD [Stygiolobus caldivivus]